MLGLTRGFSTLIGAAIAGFLIWLATQLDNGTPGGYWAVYGIVAAAGLTMALSQILGGWTKWGWPRIDAGVLLVGFLPALVVGGWVLLASQPDANWFRDHVQAWSADIGVRDVVFDLNDLLGAIAFGLGLAFGLVFDTVPRTPVAPTAGPPAARSADEPGADEPTAAEHREVATHDGYPTREPAPAERDDADRERADRDRADSVPSRE